MYTPIANVKTKKKPLILKLLLDIIYISLEHHHYHPYNTHCMKMVFDSKLKYLFGFYLLHTWFLQEVVVFFYYLF